MHTLRRHYFISNDLDDLEVFEEQLEAAGVATPQIHVLSPDDAGLAQHQHLHEVQSFSKTDIFHSTLRGAVIGFCVSVLILSIAYFAGWTQTAAGWMPFIFLSIVLLGFCTWEGGLLGIQRKNHNFAHFEQAMKDGKHVFFVDLEQNQEDILEKILKSHKQVELAGTGTGNPDWLVGIQQRLGMIRHS